MIVEFDYKKTKEHERELAACANIVATSLNWKKETLDKYLTAEEYYRCYFSTARGIEFAGVIDEACKGRREQRILDVGAGRGETSLYLADRGHTVHAVEPSPDFCNVIEFMAGRFAKTMLIYKCTAEHLNRAQETFDIAIFNASLHHCDDPALALRNCHRLLGKDGIIIIANEPVLPFFRSHQWQHDHLEKNPEITGHYGGNEHSYHFPEYKKMIEQAGFTGIRTTLQARYRNQAVLEQSLLEDTNQAPLRQLIKRAYLNFCYLLTKLSFTSVPILVLMKRLSLLQVSFTATKRTSE